MLFKIKTINKKISLVFIITIVLLILTSNLVLYFVFSRITLNRVIDDHTNIMQKSKVNIENLANSVNQTTVYLYTDKTIGETLNSKDEDAVNKISDLDLLSSTFNNYVNVPISSAFNTYFAALFIYDNFPIARELKASKLADTFGHLNGIFGSKEASKEDWYRNTVASDGSLYTFMLDSDKSKVFIARLTRNKYILNSQSLDAIGVVVIGIDLKYFANQVEGSKLTKSSKIMLINNEDQVLYSNDNALIGRNIATNPLAASITGMEPNTPATITFQGKRYLSSNYKLHWSWRMITFIPYEDIYAELGLIERIVIIETAVGILIGVFITLMLSRSISNPIKKLAGVMKRVKDEESLDIYLETKNNDEVGVLYHSFNVMMKRVGTLLGDVYESSRRQKNAELKALQAQINPHFVYNTLDSINWMALCKNEEEISSMIISLAYIMRYSIKNPDERVEISEEVKFVRSYVQIQSIRYDNNFDIHYEMDADLLNMLIPKFIIQPLIENAIIHGTEHSSRRGAITLSVAVKAGALEIVVSDNGAGAEAAELNEYLAGERTLLADSDGFGIKNINERLKMNFGEKYGLRYESNQDYGISAIISIPLKEACEGSPKS